MGKGLGNRFTHGMKHCAAFAKDTRVFVCSLFIFILVFHYFCLLLLLVRFANQPNHDALCLGHADEGLGYRTFASFFCRYGHRNRGQMTETTDRQITEDLGHKLLSRFAELGLRREDGGRCCPRTGTKARQTSPGHDRHFLWSLISPNIVTTTFLLLDSDVSQGRKTGLVPDGCMLAARGGCEDGLIYLAVVTPFSSP